MEPARTWGSLNTCNCFSDWAARGPEHMGETMDAFEGPDLDTTQLRAHYGSAIDAYESAARALDSNRVPVAPASFGAGFAPEGARIAEALEELHQATHTFLAVRTQNWRSIVELSHVVEGADADSAAGFSGVVGL